MYESRDMVFLQRMYFERPDGPFSREIRALPELEGVESSEEAETEDDLETEELVEEVERAENIERRLKMLIVKMPIILAKR